MKQKKQVVVLVVLLLIAGLIWFGFYPQSLVRMVTPTFRTYFTATK